MKVQIFMIGALKVDGQYGITGSRDHGTTGLRVYEGLWNSTLKTPIVIINRRSRLRPSLEVVRLVGGT
jgi:hypothetical protein